MPLQQNGNYNNNGFNQNQSGERQKTNFPVGRRQYGTDGTIEVTVWKSDSAIYTILMIKQAIGKDPATGANVYEQKQPKEIPRAFLNPEALRALIEGAKLNQDFTIPLGRNGSSSVSVSGFGTSQVKLTITNEKLGTRSISFGTIPIGTTTICPTWTNVTKLLEVAMKKALFDKLDLNEFGMAIGGDDEEELPI